MHKYVSVGVIYVVVKTYMYMCKHIFMDRSNLLRKLLLLWTMQLGDWANIILLGSISLYSMIAQIRQLSSAWCKCVLAADIPYKWLLVCSYIGQRYTPNKGNNLIFFVVFLLTENGHVVCLLLHPQHQVCFCVYF